MTSNYPGYPPSDSNMSANPVMAPPKAPPYQPAAYPTQPPAFRNQSAPYPTQPAGGYLAQPAGGYLAQPAGAHISQPTSAYPPQQPPQYGFTQPPYKPPEQGDPVITVVNESSLDAEFPAFQFSEKSIRQAFIRKVFIILTLQLSFTVALTALFIFEENVKYFVQHSIGTYISAYVTFFVLYIVLICCPSVRRSHPTNLILLSLFTVVLAYMVATISSFHDTNIVFLAAAICAGSCLGVIIFSFHTKFDFTSCGGFLFVAAWGLFLFGFICIFTYNSILQTVYAGLGALLFLCFLAYDTQLIMGGKKYSLSPEEYIFAALQLYLDIVYVFLFILSILGGSKK